MRTRALCIRAVGQVDVREKEIPPLGPADLLVAVRVGGVCRGDVEAFRGDEGVPLPYIGGHESAGEVVEVGADVAGFTVGDNVALLGDGRFSELTVARADKAAPLPEKIEDWSQWIVEPVACAVNGVDVARIRPDDVVGVVGCGFMGLLVTRALGLAPAREIIGFDVLDNRLTLARRSGAAKVFRSDAALDTVVAEVASAVVHRPIPAAYVLPGLQNGPLDVVFETSGTAAGLELATRLVRIGGTVVMFGHQRGAVTIDGTAWHLKGIHVINGSPMSAVDFHEIFRRTASLMHAGRLDLRGLVSHSADLDHAQSVFDASAGPGYTKGAILLNGSLGAKVAA